jgi:hypothetical protein
MSNYPEHEKLRARQTEASTLSSFIDFLAEQQWEIAEYDDVSERLFTIRLRPEEIIGMFLEIDPKKLEKEKQAMLAEIRKTTT